MQLFKSLEAASGTKISRQTVSRRLADASIFRRVAKKAPWLSKRHKADRLKWAKRHAHWTVEDWGSVFWTDESKFQLFDSNKRRLYVSRRKGEQYRDDCLQHTVKHGCGGIMVLGSFSAAGVGSLHRISGIMDQNAYLDIVKDVEIPCARRLLGDKLIY